MLKKIILMILSVICVFTATCSLSVSADDSTSFFYFDDYNYLVYSVSDGKATITSCYCGGDIVIPEEIEGYPVTTIGYRAFHLREMITGILLPDNLIRIEDEAFAGCKLLKSLVIPKNVQSIGSHAIGYDFVATTVSVGKKYTDITLSGFENTAAETYANENGFTFIALDDDPDTTTTTTDVTTTTTETTTDSTETTTETTTTSDEESTATTTKSETTSLTSDTTTEINFATTTITTAVVTTDEAETTDSIENITATTETTTTATTHIASDDELCEWAVKDYVEKTGVKPANAEIEYTADDTAIITLIDAEGNVLDVYTIDPNTGTGTESDGGEVNLPQTGYSKLCHTAVALAGCATVIGGVMVIGSGVLKKKR